MNAPHATGLAARIADLALGIEPVRRRLVTRSLLPAAIYAASVVFQILAAAFGLADPAKVAWLCCYMLTGPVVFYGLLRSGWSQRLDDPAMSVAQMLFAATALALSYPFIGQLRGLALLLLAMLPVFGFQAMDLRKSIFVAAFSLCVFGATMLTSTLLDPAQFDPRIELAHFLFAVVCVPATTLLLNRINTLRTRLRTERNELQAALERIEAISTRDELTGLVNRRHVTALLDAEVVRRKREASPFCVCLLDIDHFKRINDTLGHAAGDEVLRRFAAIAATGLRDADVLARWGGEEFLLILPFTPLQAAVAEVKSLRRRLADPAAWIGCPAQQVRVSAGLAEDGRTGVQAILERADRALYRAKDEGRDRLVLAEPVAADPPGSNRDN